MIQGVVVSPLRIIPDDRGGIMHLMRADTPPFDRFGEVYFSWVNAGAVKAWRRHRRMTVNLAVPLGRVSLVLFDDRPGSDTAGQVMDLILAPEDYALVTVPPGLWSGFLGLAPAPSLVVNCATHVHDPDEIDRREPDDPSIPYAWPR